MSNGSFTGNQAVVLGLASGHGLMKAWTLADDEGRVYRNHIARCHKKLDVKNKAELANLLGRKKRLDGGRF